MEMHIHKIDQSMILKFKVIIYFHLITETDLLLSTPTYNKTVTNLAITSTLSTISLLKIIRSTIRRPKTYLIIIRLFITHSIISLLLITKAMPITPSIIRIQSISSATLSNPHSAWLTMALPTICSAISLKTSVLLIRLVIICWCKWCQWCRHMLPILPLPLPKPSSNSQKKQ